MKRAIRLTMSAVLIAMFLLVAGTTAASAAVEVKSGTVNHGGATLDYTIVISTGSYGSGYRSIITVGGGVSAGWWAFEGATGTIHIRNYGIWSYYPNQPILSGDKKVSQTVDRNEIGPYFYATVIVPTPYNVTYTGSGVPWIHLTCLSHFWIGIGETVWVGAYTPYIIEIEKTGVESAQTVLNGLLAALQFDWLLYLLPP
jgi:hypothetical protein